MIKCKFEYYQILKNVMQSFGNNVICNMKFCSDKIETSLFDWFGSSTVNCSI